MDMVMRDKPIAAGKSSFDLVDTDTVYRELGLGPGMVLVDIASGAGNYTFPAAAIVGPRGDVHAVDLWREGIESLASYARERGLDNIHPAVADVSEAIPLEDGAADACLIATALHDLVEDGAGAGTLREAARVLKTGGRLTVVEFNKTGGPPGPPQHVRLSPQELDDLVAPFGFSKVGTVSTGEHTYATTYLRD